MGGIILLAIVVVLMYAQWRIFEKAGKPGWAAIIPIYSFIVLMEIIKKPWYWIFFMLIPLANIYFMIVIFNGLSKSFGKSEGFTVGLILLGIVFFPILGFGDAKYIYDGAEVEGNDEILDSDMV